MLDPCPEEPSDAGDRLRIARPLTPVANLCPPLEVAPEKADVFRLALRTLTDAGIPFSIGGGIAVFAYTGAHRDAHDLDIHLLPDDVERAMAVLRQASFRVHVRLQPWLAQAHHGQTQVDLIYGHGTWHASVDRRWIERGTPFHVLNHDVMIIPPEELLWTKALRCARVRSDQSDVLHLLLALGSQLDWPYLLERFGEDWEILLSHLIMFRYVFPAQHHVIPEEILDDLLARMHSQRSDLDPWPPVCRGQIIDSSGPFADYTERGYVDERQRRWQQRLDREPVLHRLIPAPPQ